MSETFWNIFAVVGFSGLFAFMLAILFVGESRIEEGKD